MSLHGITDSVQAFLYGELTGPAAALSLPQPKAMSPHEDPVVRTEQEEKNVRLVRRMYEVVLDRTDSAAVDGIFDPSYIQHNPSIPSGAHSLKEMLDRARVKYPQVKHVVKRMIADGDLVAAHVHVTFEPGSPGFAVVDIFRLANDRIMEHWDVMQPVATEPKNQNSMF